ncbi:beta-eliminating lyase-related protein [Salipiger sp. P9]|uniref:threonine aldolase family protein n=1 Tax=Salipiger pentaromativorans TaxID=2943193 RepID=UPI002157CE7E|nr:beta-eliminating lyase-related protein [Salipiger pentaromativorans]MCR8547953.1 beta-eliminating lyase-related protein [Salipiger pentaromativorans]
MFFASDNSGPVAPQVLEALARANDGYAPGYGSDTLSEQVVERLRALFEAPEAAVYLVPTGTAANVLSLACLCPPYATVFCSPVAHIQEDECNAPEFYTGGAKLTLVGDGDRMRPEALRAAIANEETRGVHGPLRGPVSITQVAERGNVYSLDALRALTDVAREFGLPVHLDGARFSNAAVKLGVTPAEMSWKIGVDICVFGGTKNGLMGVEAVLIFDPAKAAEFELRRKRGALLFSKHRYLAAQMAAYLDGDLWHDLASRANARGDQLVQGLKGMGVAVRTEAHANVVFFEMPRRVHRAVQEAGAVYHLWDDLEGPGDSPALARLVCDWSLSPKAVSDFLDLVGKAL